IRVESTPGQGSTFHFIARFGLQTDPMAQTPPAPTNLEHLPVLVVDDNDTNRRILTDVLANWRMQPVAVPSGPAALAEMKRAHAAGQPYPLALLDAMMPEMDGYMLARHIKQPPGFAGSTLLMLSSAEGSMARAREPGIAACLMKPVKQSELFNAIVNSLGVAQQRQAESAATPAVAPGSRRLRILVVEDNAVNQKLVVRLLEKRGHRVTLASTGKAALAALEREAFALALMDVQMPERGGCEATAAIRKQEQTSGTHLPIIAMTAHAMKGDRERCLEAGMDGYVSKPVQARELFEVIERTVPAAAPPDAEPDGP